MRDNPLACGVYPGHRRTANPTLSAHQIATAVPGKDLMDGGLQPLRQHLQLLPDVRIMPLCTSAHINRVLGGCLQGHHRGRLREGAESYAKALASDILSGEIDVFPSERRNMSPDRAIAAFHRVSRLQQPSPTFMVFQQKMMMAASRTHAGGGIMLAVGGTVADFTAAVEADCPLQRMMSFTFVEPDLGTPLELSIQIQ